MCAEITSGRFALSQFYCSSRIEPLNRHFRVMCHSGNGLWELAEVDMNSIKPQAPSGASGGVEFEAMDYLVSCARGGSHPDLDILPNMPCAVDDALPDAQRTRQSSIRI